MASPGQEQCLGVGCALIHLAGRMLTPKGVYLGDLLVQEVYKAGTRAGFPSVHFILQPWGLPCAPASLSANHCFSQS